MSKGARARTDMTRALNRLIQALGEAGAGAAPSDLEDDVIVVLAPRNGVTVVRARLPAAAGRSAVSEGLAAWAVDGTARRLRLKEAGRAWLRRHALQDEDLDPFRAQHGDHARRALEKGAKPSLVNEAESPLAWLARRKGADGKAFLEPAQFEVGERFRRDLEQAQILQRVTASWEAPASASRRGGDAGVVVTEIAMDARKRLDRACEAVGPDLSGLLLDVCGYLKGLETVESERGWPARSGKVVLKIALGRLAGHYGIGDTASGPARAKGLLHWGAEDYRPSL
jgi:Domain of unknown function (DUF6456)